jgi:PAS domain S-box-containing protein
MFPTPILFGISVVLQVAAVIFALRMARRQSIGTPWLVLAGALLLMLGFRLFGLLTFGSHPVIAQSAETSDLITAVFSAGISTLLFASLFLIRRALAEREVAEAARRETEDRLAAIVSYSPTVIFAKDAQGRYLIANSRFQEKSGMSPADVTGKTDYDLFPKEVADTFWKADQKVLSSRTPCTYEETFEYDGQSLTYLTTKFPLFDPADNAYAVCSIATDISERKNSEQQLRKTEQSMRESEERLRLGLEAGNTGTWDWDVGNNHVTWSEKIYRFHGLRPGDFSGKVEDFAPLIHPDDRERVAEAIRRALEEHATYRVEYRALQPSGDIRWVSTTGEVSFDDQGKAVRMLGAASDITELKAAEETLRHTADRLRQAQVVTEALSEALTTEQVAAVVVDQGITAMGASAGSMALFSEDGSTLNIVRATGYPPDVIEPWRSFSIHADVPLAEAARTGKTIFIESAERRHSEYPALIALRPQNGTAASACVPLTVGGRVIGAMGLSFSKPGQFSEEDKLFMTALGRQCALSLERARLYEREHEARAEAERASRAKDEFLAVLSHELRTPLTPVLLTVSLIESHPQLPDDLRDDMATIRRNVELESRLIGDLLDLTRIAKGKLQLDVQDVDLHLLIRSAIDICQREASARLETELTATHHIVRGDSTRLQQVFWNLINNAQKFTPPSGTIVIRSLDAPDGRVRVEVNDTGEGIDPSVISKLFNAFEQGETRSDRQFAGLGLGLAISRKLVDAHGGTITARSDGRGSGATFTVDLPASAAPPANSLPSVAQGPGPAADGLRILVVEDHEATLRVLSRLLSRMGHHVTAAPSLASALAAADRETFDVLLSDLGLPDGSGLDLIRQLGARYAGRSIALTGYGMEDDIQSSRNAGFAAHLTKPVDIDLLGATIREVAAAANGENRP